MRVVQAQFNILVRLPAGDTLSGKSLKFTVKADASVADTTNLFQKTSSPANGITITGDLTALLEIDAADTSSLTNEVDQIYIYDLVLTDGANVYPIAFESFTIQGNVTEAIV